MDLPKPKQRYGKAVTFPEMTCCKECGSLVVDKRVHSQWHDRIMEHSTADSMSVRWVG